MTEKLRVTAPERVYIIALYTQLKETISPSLNPGDEEHIRHHLLQAVAEGHISRDVFGLNPIVLGLQTALLVVDEIGLRRDAVLAIMLYPSVAGEFISIDEVRSEFGESVGRILHAFRNSTRRTLSSRVRTSAICCSPLPKICGSSSS